MRNLSRDEKRRTPHQTSGTIHFNAKPTSEGGLYKIIMRSDKTEALAFQDWVANTVLPAIRKEGGYVTGEEKVQTEQDLMEMSLRTMDILRKKLDEKSKQLGARSREYC